MNKFTIAAVAVISALALNAEVTSANCVGYNNIGTPKGGFRFVTPDFERVDGETLTFGDVKAEGFGKSTVKLFNNKGGVVKTMIPAGEGGIEVEVSGNYKYYDGEELYTLMYEDDQKVYGYTYPSEIHPPSGWYLNYKNVLYCKNDVQIGYGNAFVVDSQDSSGKILSSGSVLAEDAKVTLTKGGFNFTGNCMPVDYTLADFVAIGFGKSTLKFFTEKGAVVKTMIPAGVGGTDIEVSGNYKYYDGEELYALMDPEKGDDQQVYGYVYPSEIHPPSGWYLNYKNVLYCKNAIPVTAGLGIVVDCQDNGAKLQIPSPLVKKD